MYLMENYSRLPVSFVKGEGVYLYDEKGNRYLDLIAGLGVVSLGHSHPGVVEVINRQSAELLHISNLFLNPWQEELAEKLVREFGSPAKVFFCNSGTEANEAAIKLTRRYWRLKNKSRYRIITFWKSFHGRTYGSLSATAQKEFHYGFEPLLEGFDYAYLNDMDSVKKAFRRETAAVMLEVIQGEGGINECEKDFLKELQNFCKEKEILLIVDEVQTGVGRTGLFFGFQHYGITPDMVTLAKGLGSGIPIGALIAKEEIASAFTVGSHGSTFGGNALACKVASFVVDTVKDMLPSVKKRGDFFQSKLQELRIGKVKGKGLMIGLEMEENCKEMVLKALEKGLIINCTSGNVLRFLPPLVITENHIEEAIAVLKDII